MYMFIYNMYVFMYVHTRMHTHAQCAYMHRGCWL